MWLTCILCFICGFLIRENWKRRLDIKKINDEIKNRWQLMDSNASKANEIFIDLRREIKKLSDAIRNIESTFDKVDFSKTIKELEKKILQNTQNIQSVFKFGSFKSTIQEIKKDVRENKTKVNSTKS